MAIVTLKNLSGLWYLIGCFQTTKLGDCSVFFPRDFEIISTTSEDRDAQAGFRWFTIDEATPNTTTMGLSTSVQWSAGKFSTARSVAGFPKSARFSHGIQNNSCLKSNRSSLSLSLGSISTWWKLEISYCA